MVQSEIDAVLRLTRSGPQAGDTTQSEFARVTAMTSEVVADGDRTAMLAGRIHTLAIENQEAARGISGRGERLGAQIVSLLAQVSSHDQTATAMAEQVLSAQEGMVQIAAITEENNAVARQSQIMWIPSLKLWPGWHSSAHRLPTPPRGFVFH